MFIDHIGLYLSRMSRVLAVLFCLLSIPGGLWAAGVGDEAQQRLRELNQLAAKHVYSQPAKALEYAGEALQRAVALQDQKEQSIALLSAGLAYMQQGDLAASRRNLEESIVAAQLADYTQGVGDGNNFLGTCVGEEGLYDQSMKYYTRALEIRTSLGDRIGMSKTINNLGIINRRIANYEGAIQCFEQSLGMKEDKDLSGRSNTLTNMAMAYAEMQDYERALDLMKEALAVAMRINYPQGKAFAYRSMGEVQLEMGNLSDAQENLWQAAQLYEQVGYSKGVAFALYSLGRVYETQGDKALAMEQYHRAMEIAHRIGKKKLLSEIYYRSAKLMKENRENSTALEYYEKAIQVERELSQEEIKQRIALQQISYESDKKQYEIDYLKSQAERRALEARHRDNLLLAAGVSLFFFGLIALYLREQLQIKHKKEQELLTVTYRLEEAKERLNRLAETDHLTNVANRRSFDLKYQEQYDQACHVGATLSVIVVDIDLFKQYNDIYGHQQGDECLKIVSETLQSVILGTDWLLARYGGEEFVIVAQVDQETGVNLSEQARQAIEELTFLHSGSPFGLVTCSFGVAAERVLAGSSPEALLKRADQALYRAKSRGRNCVST